MRKDHKWAVNTRSSVPVYKQIENQIRFAIADGRFKTGDTLPSVREMSNSTGVNPNTVTKAYRDLELLGVVQTRRGVGVTVTARNSKKLNGETRNAAKAHLREAAAECLYAGCSAAEVRKIVAAAIKDNPPPYDPSP